MAPRIEEEDVTAENAQQRRRREAEEAIQKHKESQRQRVEEAKQRIRARREAAAAAKEETYEVQAGDTLGKIAQKVYGDGSRWKEIYEANKDTIENPDLIQVGQKLRIPKG